jgi:hypothetical protein
MAKTLELQFATEMGGTARITIDNLKTPLRLLQSNNQWNRLLLLEYFTLLQGI